MSIHTNRPRRRGAVARRLAAGRFAGALVHEKPSLTEFAADPHFSAMTDVWTADRWEEAVRAVFRRALLDPAFRQRALTDAPGAFAEANGVPPPEGVRFRFAESLDEHVLVLPKVVLSQGELSEIDIARILHHAFRQQSIPPAPTGPVG